MRIKWNIKSSASGEPRSVLRLVSKNRHLRAFLVFVSIRASRKGRIYMSLSIDEPVCHGSAIKCSFVRSLTFGLLALAAMSITPNPPEMNHAAIPFLNTAAAGQQYPGDGLSITRSADGAYLHCGFQKIDGCATEEGLWLVSTAGASNS